MSTTNRTLKEIIDGLVEGAKKQVADTGRRFEAEPHNVHVSDIKLKLIIKALHLAGNASDAEYIGRTAEIINNKQTMAFTGGEQAARRFHSILCSLLKEGAFKTWFEKLDSGTVTVMSEHNGTWQASSHMVALLAQTASLNIPHTRTLVYYCAQHDPDVEGRAGVPAMMKSLIAQLLLYRIDDGVVLSVFDYVQNIEIIQDKAATRLIDIFATLIKRVRGGTIFCIIDSIHMFLENECGAMEYLMMTLHKLVGDVNAKNQTGQTQLNFKVLVTAYDNRQELRIWFPEQTHFALVKSPGRPRDELKIESY